MINDKQPTYQRQEDNFTRELQQCPIVQRSSRAEDEEDKEEKKKRQGREKKELKDVLDRCKGLSLYHKDTNHYLIEKDIWGK